VRPLRSGLRWVYARTCCWPWRGFQFVLARYPDVLTAIRLVGGAYLLYLGGRLVIPTFRRSMHQAAPPETVSPRSAFAQGLFTNLLNPKAVLFFAAVLPQFIAAGPAPAWVQIGVLGLLDVVLGFVAWAVVIMLGLQLSTVLKRQAARRWWDRGTGTALAGLGGGLILARD